MFPPIDPERERPTAELDWAAFRYLAGEDSESDRLAFEARLADDQEAREALAAAVELAGAVRLVEAGRRARRPAWPRWAVLASAAAVAVACWVGAGSDRSPRTSPSEVAIAWSDLRQPAPASNDEPADPTRDDEPIDVPGDVPGWLFDALEAPDLVL